MTGREGGEPPSASVVLGLGSNLGDRMARLQEAVRALRGSGLVLGAVSSIYETAPIGFLRQPFFLNLVLSASSGLSPAALLALCHRLETDAGRERTFPNAPRSLDVDVLFLGDRIVRLPGLHVPHPRWKERSFVVRPLQEILPDLRDPETGWRVEEVARRWPIRPLEVHRALEGSVFLASLEQGAT